MLTIRGIFGREMYETWYKMTVMVEGGLDIRPVITHRFHYSEFERGFEALLSATRAKLSSTERTRRQRSLVQPATSLDPGSGAPPRRWRCCVMGAVYPPPPVSLALRVSGAGGADTRRPDLGRSEQGTQGIHHFYRRSHHRNRRNNAHGSIPDPAPPTRL